MSDKEIIEHYKHLVYAQNQTIAALNDMLTSANKLISKL